MKGYYSKPLPHEDDGDVYTMEEWKELLHLHIVSPHDGTGYQATELGYDRTLDAFAWPADDCTHIVWFNK